MLADAEDVEDRSAAQRATTEQSQDMCDFDEEVAIEGEPAMVNYWNLWIVIDILLTSHDLMFDIIDYSN